MLTAIDEAEAAAVVAWATFALVSLAAPKGSYGGGASSGSGSMSTSLLRDMSGPTAATAQLERLYSDAIRRRAGQRG